MSLNSLSPNIALITRIWRLKPRHDVRNTRFGVGDASAATDIVTADQEDGDPRALRHRAIDTAQYAGRGVAVNARIAHRVGLPPGAKHRLLKITRLNEKTRWI
jgi:hypothetical protein